jgi:hypothetical protein
MYGAKIPTNLACIEERRAHSSTFDWSRFFLTVKQVVQNELLEDLFYLPLSQQACQQIMQLELICDRATNITQEWVNWLLELYLGRWTFINRKGIQLHDWISTISTNISGIWKSSPVSWNTSFLPGCIFYDRLNTRNLLKRKNFQLQSYNCATT